MVTVLLVFGTVVFAFVLFARIGLAMAKIFWKFGPALGVLFGLALILHLVGAL